MSTRIYTPQDRLFIEAERKFYQKELRSWMATDAAYAALRPRADGDDFSVCCNILAATYDYGNDAMRYLDVLRQEDDLIAHTRRALAAPRTAESDVPTLPWWVRVSRWLGLS